MIELITLIMMPRRCSDCAIRAMSSDDITQSRKRVERQMQASFSASVRDSVLLMIVAGFAGRK